MRVEWTGRRAQRAPWVKQLMDQITTLIMLRRYLGSYASQQWLRGN